MSTCRCINYDWVEVFCLETEGFPPRTADYYRSIHGFDSVVVRDYGTPMYTEMFTVFSKKSPIMEIRRDPKSKQSEGGIFPDNCCHLRLPNRMCYGVDPIGFLFSFLKLHHLEFVSIKRIDLALDFVKFDSGDDPAAFLRRYHANKYAKMYQREFKNHGDDGWQTKLYNSIKWGSPSSDISTKLYDKTMELDRPSHDKPYIREAWKNCGLDTSKHVWRVEFSISSSYKNAVRDTDGSIMPIDLFSFRDRNLCLNMFMMLADRYFDFRYVETLPNGKLQRKDRCRRKVLFDIKPYQTAYRPLHEPTVKRAYDRTLFQVIKRLAEIANDVAETERQRTSVMTVCSMIVKHYAVDEFHYEWLSKVMDGEFFPSILKDLLNQDYNEQDLFPERSED